MIELQETDGFSFEVEGSELLSALNKVNSIAGADKVTDAERVFVMIASGKKLYVLSYTPDTFCYVRVKAKVKGDGFFGFDMNVVSRTLKGRKDLSVVIGKEAVFKSGRYNVSLKIYDVPGNARTAIENYLRVTKTEKMSSVDMGKIRSAIKLVDIQDIYAGGKNCCYMTIRKGKLMVSSYDQFHFVVVKETVEYPDTQVAFYSTTFRLLDKFIGDSDVSLYVGRHMRIESEDFVVCLPPQQVEQSQFSMISNLLAEQPEAEATFELNSAAVKALHNISGLLEKDDRLDITVSDGRVDLSINSAKGSIKDSYKCKTSGEEVKFTLDPRLLLDLHRKLTLPAKINLNGVVKGASSLFTAKQDNIQLGGSYYVN